jgi:membrane protein DedA with SNARE-associated domain
MLRRMLSSLAHWVQDQVAAHGLSAVFVLMVLESACIPIPSEVTMVYAGYLVSQGDMNFVAAVLVGSVANLVGSLIAWTAGAYGVDSLLVRSPSNRAHLAQAHRWFERWGSPVVFFSRMLPLVRTFISLPAGMARMPVVRFSVLTFLGCIPWCILLVAAGDLAGRNWDTWHRRIGYLDYLVVAAAVAAVGVWLVRRRRAFGH